MLTNREHIIALEARDNGLVGLLLRYPYEVRAAADYFDDIKDVNITKDMLDLARHIVEQKSGHFEPTAFEDHYEKALNELLAKKQKGLPITAARKDRKPSNVVDLMDALRASLKSPEKTAPGRPAKAPAKKVVKKRKAGYAPMPAVPHGSLSHRGVEMKNKGMTDQEVILDALEQAQRILADYMEPGPSFRAGIHYHQALACSRPKGPCARTRAPKGKVRAAAGEIPSPTMHALRR